MPAKLGSKVCGCCKRKPRVFREVAIEGGKLSLGLCIDCDRPRCSNCTQHYGTPGMDRSPSRCPHCAASLLV